MKFENISTILDDILKCQRSPLDKTSLGYDNNKEGESSKLMDKKIEEKLRSYVDHHKFQRQQK